MVKKPKASTFFPKSWDRQKTIEEMAYALKKKKFDSSTINGKTGYITDNYKSSFTDGTIAIIHIENKHITGMYGQID